MAKERSIDTRFWEDGFVRKLNALDRYLFLYLLTNEHTTWCGVYELPLDVMAFESGIDEKELTKTMLPRLLPKIIYVEGWVYIPNWIRYHMSESGNLSPQQQKGYEKSFSLIPERIRLQIKEIEKNGIPSTYPIGGVLASASTFTSTSTFIATTSPTPKDENLDFFKGGDTYIKIRSMLLEKIPEAVVDARLKEFSLYWTEPNKSGTRQRWEQQQTFEIKRRIRTWFLNDKKFNNKPKGKMII